MALPKDYDARKALPIYSGVLKYFPDAIAAVAHCSKVGNDQHNPGEPLHWAREKSTDEHNTCVRHLLEAGTFDSDGVRHSAKAAWRALAALQKEIEADGGVLHALSTAETAEITTAARVVTAKAEGRTLTADTYVAADPATGDRAGIVATLGRPIDQPCEFHERSGPHAVCLRCRSKSFAACQCVSYEDTDHDQGALGF
jgi:uncharacterized membrane protein